MKPFVVPSVGQLENDQYNARFYEAAPDPSHHSFGQLVFIHGTAGSFQEQFGEVAALLAADHHVYGLDLDSSGDNTGELQLDTLVAQVEQFLEDIVKPDNPGEPTTLVGYSLGAVVSTVLASRRPDLVDRLVTVCGWAVTGEQQRLFNRVWFDLWENQSPQLPTYMFNHFFGGPAQDEMPPGMADQIISGMTMTETVARQMRLNDQIDISAELELVEAPTLVIGSTYDQLVPLRQVKYLFGGIENARFYEITSGHAVVYERTTQLVRVLDLFHSDPSQQEAGTILPQLIA
jgi:pimeloyl-ACP methyl ester carboxylesterase